jgi:regulator of PEP synthase PpsR (kinase-PPPase family)
LKQVVIVSDSSGLTADITVNAILPQFRNIDVAINRVTMVRNRARLVEAINLAKNANSLIVYTLTSEGLRSFFLSQIVKNQIKAVDIMGPLLEAFTEFLGIPPLREPGRQRKLSKSYFRGIEAIEYTVNHDDGQDSEKLNLADIVIVGVSRTSKTPLSIFLSSRYLLRIANIPIILEFELPSQIFSLDKNRIIGLTISPKRLLEIRKARVERASFRVPPRYADYAYIQKELEYSNRLFKINGWAVIDVTEKSIEETAAEALRLINILAHY